MDDNAKSRITEDLSTLYLRLNGYFTSGFILHSPERGRVHSEIDCIGVRFPLNSEPERGIGADPFLQPTTSRIDVALCEVKRKGQQLQFNKALRKELDRLKRVLRWIGLFPEDQLDQLAQQVMEALTPKEIASNAVPEVIVDERVRIRGLIFSPERDCSSRNGNEPFFIGGDILCDYAWKCLCPDAPRPTCATVYDFTRWGHLESLVRFFKNKGHESAGTIAEIYEFLEKR